MGTRAAVRVWQHPGRRFIWRPRATRWQEKAGNVSLRFRGNETQGIDGKGRVSIPSDFRPAIVTGDHRMVQGERPIFVIVYGTQSQNHLKCYTREEIEKIEARIELMDDGSEEREMLETIFHGCAMNMQLGDDGRIVLPQKLRQKLDLDDKVFFMAGNDHFKMWKPETYEAYENDRTDQLLRERGDRFNPTSLLPKLPPKAAAPV